MLNIKGLEALYFNMLDIQKSRDFSGTGIRNQEYFFKNSNLRANRLFIFLNLYTNNCLLAFKEVFALRDVLKVVV